jgi:hypothetical protein
MRSSHTVRASGAEAISVLNAMTCQQCRIHMARSPKADCSMYHAAGAGWFCDALVG